MLDGTLSYTPSARERHRRRAPTGGGRDEPLKRDHYKPQPSRKTNETKTAKRRPKDCPVVLTQWYQDAASFVPPTVPSWSPLSTVHEETSIGYHSATDPFKSLRLHPWNSNPNPNKRLWTKTFPVIPRRWCMERGRKIGRTNCGNGLSLFEMYHCSGT